MPPKMKDPTQLLDDADGNSPWLKEALEAIWRRLPPADLPAPPTTAPLPSFFAQLFINPGYAPLSGTNRWYLATWLEGLAKQLRDGTLDEGDSHQGYTTIFTLDATQPTSGPRQKRNEP